MFVFELASLVLLVQSAVSLNSRAAAVGGMTGEVNQERGSPIRNTGRVSQWVFPIMQLVHVSPAR